MRRLDRLPIIELYSEIDLTRSRVARERQSQQRTELGRMIPSTRVDREIASYENEQLQRGGFDAALTYLNEGIGRLRRNEVIRRAMQDAAGMRVLELGSQSWEWCLFRYGYQPDQLTCINVSETELEIGRVHAAKLGFACDFRKMDAHNLEFPDGSFDMVFGVAILHHLEFARAMREIHRVLGKEGKIVFMEPLRHNPVARLVRWLTPYARTPDELPLGRPELRLIEKNFQIDNYYSELFTVIGAMLAQPLFKSPINPLTRFCNLADELTLQLVPAAGVYYRSVVIRGTKMARSWTE
jgi:SAM-dependent methyltransferase